MLLEEVDEFERVLKSSTSSANLILKEDRE